MQKQKKSRTGLKEEIEDYEELCRKATEYKEKIKQLKAEKASMRKQNPSLAVAKDTPEYAGIRTQIAEMQQKYAQVNQEIDKQAPRLEKTYDKLEKIKAKQSENNVKIAEFKSKIESANMGKVQNSVEKVGKSISSQIGKIGRMTLAIAAIRTAWGLVNSTINLVAQNNKQVATDFEYMKFAIAQTLLPVIQKLIGFLYTVLSYINAIANAWFGINLFGNASVKSFQKMKNSASGTAKATKEIKKSLQGFDEANVISDTSSGGSGAGSSTPSMDLSGIQGDVPEWMKWIIENKDLVLAVLAGIASGLLAVKLGLDPIKSLGLGVLIAGIVYTIQALIAYLNNPSWENFGKLLQGVGAVILGLGILIGSVPAIVVGAIVLIVGIIVKYWNQIKDFLQNGIDWLSGKSEWVHYMFGDTLARIYDIFVDRLQEILNIFDSVFTAIKGIFDGLIMFITGVFTGDWQKAWEGIKKIFSSIWEGLKGIVISVWNFIKSLVVNIAKSVGDVISGVFKAIVNSVLWAIESILNKPINTINGLIGIINNVPGIHITKLNTFNLPRMARGGIVNQPTQAIIGEAGAEAVIPLENNTEGLKLLANMIASQMNASTANGTVNVYLDGRLIQRQVCKRTQELAFATNGR